MRLPWGKEVLVAHRFSLVAVILVGILAPLQIAAAQGTVEFKGCKFGDEVLSSWREGPIKRQLIAFVVRVAGEGRVPVEDRIATLDLDGTLMCEKPDYVEVEVAVKRLCELAQEEPETHKGPLYEAACDRDMGYINEHVEDALLTAFEGSSQTAFQEYVGRFLDTVKHPRFDIPYGDLIYEPMGELVNYLRCNGFTIHLVSGSQQGFVRTVSKEQELAPLAIGVGRAVDLEYVYSPASDGPRITRKDHFIRQHDFLPPNPSGPGKAIAIETRIGKMPILAVGNTMGDAEMLMAATASTLYPGLAMIINHDDPREYIYADEELLELAATMDWLIADMSKNFVRVFAEK